MDISLLNLKFKIKYLGRKPNLNFYDLAVGIAQMHELEKSSIASLPTDANISLRRVYYLLEVGNFLRENDISKREAETIGWTKLQIITRYIKEQEETDASNLKDYFQTAKTTRARELKIVLQGGSPGLASPMVFNFDAEKKKSLVEALVSFGAHETPLGLIGKEEAMMKLVHQVTSKEGKGNP